MSKELFALGDIGATQTRVALLDKEGFAHALTYIATDPKDYEGSTQRVADLAEAESKSLGATLAAASMAIAASVNEKGVLVQAGELSPWIGNSFKSDMAAALGLREELVGANNDTVVLAISQQAINARNGRPASGVASTLSSGWGAALYLENGDVKGDEPGHQYLRPGAICPCGQEGHAEAFISGKGILKNYDMPMKEWLKDPSNAERLVIDLSNSVLDFLDRHERNGFIPQEFRWTGGVALNQPFIMERVATSIKNILGSMTAPAFDALTMGDQAGLHGTFIDARNRALAA